MRRGIAALAMIIAGVLLLWSIMSNGNGTRPVGQPAAPTHHRSSTPTTTPEVSPSIPSPALPAPEIEERPRVEFNLSWDPKKELRNVYEGKLKIVKAFERFREESGISDEQAQDILWMLHDFRETEKALDEELWSHKPFKTDAHFEFWLRKHSHALRLLVMDMEETLEQILTPEQLQVWNATVDQESPWINIGWWITEPVVVPEGMP